MYICLTICYVLENRLCIQREELAKDNNLNQLMNGRKEQEVKELTKYLLLA